MGDGDATVSSGSGEDGEGRRGTGCLCRVCRVYDVRAWCPRDQAPRYGRERASERGIRAGTVHDYCRGLGLGTGLRMPLSLGLGISFPSSLCSILYLLPPFSLFYFVRFFSDFF
jgi:hypothetical protein